MGLELKFEDNRGPYFDTPLNNIDDVELCYEVIKEYIGNEIPKNRLIDIISNTISFEIPVKEIENSIYS